MRCMICDMEINSKNYNFNSPAFLENNKEDEIYRCPFCGVSSVYFTSGEEKYKIDSSLLNENTLKILDHAVKLEIFNGEFYASASELAKDPELKKTFAALGRIEMLHSQIHKKVAGFQDTPTLTKLDYSKYNSDEALLELAKTREKHAVAYYEKYKNEVNDKLLVRIFDALAQVEREHIILTSKEGI